jgi:hypothetical protein
MLPNIDDVPDEGQVWLFMPSRVPTMPEGETVCDIINGWISSWESAFPMCPISSCHILFDAWSFLFAVDDRLRWQPPRVSGLSGSDLDPLFRTLETWGQDQTPSVTVTPGLGTLINDQVVPFTRTWLQLAKDGVLTEDTPVFSSCSVAEWRAGKFVRRLGDENPDFVAQVLTRSQ